MRVLVTGATGYVGGRLVPRLLAAGHKVVCLVRNPGGLDDRVWRNDVEVVVGDLMEADSLPPAMAGCGAAFYLVHSMGRHRDFQAVEQESAQNFAESASAAGVARVVYLGGLGRGRLSKHLASRQAVGRVLAEGSVPVTELRAAVVIGAGSLSFELLRTLTEVLPVMTTPRWVRTECQPIAIEDLLTLLEHASLDRGGQSHIIEIGGPDVLSYEQMMRIYAREAGLRRRLIIPVPVLSPGLSSLWVGLVTPLPAATARPLVRSLRNEVTVEDNRYLDLLGRQPIPFVEAVRRALEPGPSEDPAASRPTDPSWSGGSFYQEQRVVAGTVDPAALASEFMTIGGKKGYYSAPWAWRIRTLLDRLVGGPGLRRGRAHPRVLEEGEELDFWRVKAVEPGRRLVLEAEMKMPGHAELEFHADQDQMGSKLVQTASFRPRGLFGRMYWFALYPIHSVIFSRMAKAIVASAEAEAGATK